MSPTDHEYVGTIVGIVMSPPSGVSSYDWQVGSHGLPTHAPASELANGCG